MKDISILHKRGEEQNLPKGNPSELLYTTDSEKLFYGGSNENVEIAKKNDLNAISTVLLDHYQNKSNPHEVTKEQVGLGNVDNTSDENKPLSIAQKEYIDQAINALRSEIIEVIGGKQS